MKIFVVENEDLIRKGIMKYIERSDRDDQIVGEARDGEQAYPMILKTQPDILITDISMPYMSGLELSEAVRKKLPALRVIIISGYSDFKYAKKAIEMGVTDYLIKPIFSDVLLRSIEKAENEIREKQHQQMLEIELEKEKREKKEQHRQMLFDELVLGIHSIMDVYERAEALDMDLTANYYAIMIYGISYEILEQCAAYTEELLEKELGAFFEEENAYIFKRGNDRRAVLMKGKNKEEIQSTFCAFEKKIKTLDKNQRCFYGMGVIVDHIRNLSESYYSAGKMYSYHYFDFKNILDHTAAQEEQEYFFDQMDVKKWDHYSIRQFLKKGLKKDIKEFTEKYLACIGENNLSSVLFQQYLLIDIQREVMSYLNDLKESSDITEEIDTFVFQNALENQSLEKIKSYIEDILRSCMELRDQYSQDKYHQLLDEAKKYIQQNYNKDISLNTVSEYVGISPNYFSRIFGKEVGMGFAEYLGMIRIEKAKELLRNSNKKISEICFETGYSDTNYFSSVFKKKVGCTPKVYRMNVK